MSFQGGFPTFPPQGGGGGPIVLSGDATGMSNANTVVAIQNQPWSPTAPTVVNQVPTWSGTAWVPGMASVSLPVELGLTYTTPPTLEGQLYSYTANNTVDLSISDTDTKAVAFAGVWTVGQAGLQTVRGYPIYIRFAPGLTVTPVVGGITVYLSDADPGLATNVPPSTIGNFIKPIGSIVDGSMYNPAAPTGSLALCILDPQPLVAI